MEQVLHMWWTVQEYDIISLIRGLLHTSDLLISLGVIICMVFCVQLTVCKHDRQQVSDIYLPANKVTHSMRRMRRTGCTEEVKSPPLSFSVLPILSE